ncbi:hypothetical protein RIF29_40910 [Crotalaria pallida]|uniref:Uncharacterized protein n=1 Tax=Crotalaria pallida TaxID=3830 RepID=A0AAN9EA98_CROPI
MLEPFSRALVYQKVHCVCVSDEGKNTATIIVTFKSNTHQQLQQRLCPLQTSFFVFFLSLFSSASFAASEKERITNKHY